MLLNQGKNLRRAVVAHHFNAKNVTHKSYVSWRRVKTWLKKSGEL